MDQIELYLQKHPHVEPATTDMIIENDDPITKYNLVRVHAIVVFKAPLRYPESSFKQPEPKKHGKKPKFPVLQAEVFEGIDDVANDIPVLPEEIKKEVVKKLTLERIIRIIMPSRNGSN